MKKPLVWLALMFVSMVGLSQATFNIPDDTLIQTCPPDSVFLYLYADSGNSSAYTYDTIPYQTESVGGTSINMSDDQVQGPFNIGFTFSFYCNQYTQFYICSNGWIGFSAGQTATWVVQSVPSTNNNTPKNNIMGPWRDWNPNSGNGPYVSYQTVGTAPLRKLIVTWSSVPMYSCTSSQGTFQIVLHEASNIIHNNLTNVPVCTNWGNGDGTEATHNSGGTIATAVAGRNDSQFTISNQSIRFIPTSPILWSTLNGSPFAIGNGVTASFNSPQWVYANGVTCNGDTMTDSVFIAVSCIQLKMDTAIDVECTNDSSGWAVAIDTSTVTAGPYTFYWVHDGSGETLAVNNSLNEIDTLFNAPAGDYTVYAWGANSEFALGTTSIAEPDTIDSVYTTSVDVLCFGDSTGIAIAQDIYNYSSFSTWDNIYNFYWEDNANNEIDSNFNSTNDTDSALNLPTGTYNVTIDGCFIQRGPVTVDEPTEVTASISNPTTVSCPGVSYCDAGALAQGAGGVGNYQYSWSTNESTQYAVALCADTNWVTVTDGNGCDTNAFIVIGVPDSIITEAFGDTLICITNFAAMTSATTGGTSPYTYLWTSLGPDGDTISFSSGTSVNPDSTNRYLVRTMDDNGCPGDTASVLIKVRPPLGVIVPEVDTICPYDTILITMTGLGGDSLYSYAWSTGNFGPTVAVSPDLPQWFYVTVSDLCGTPTIDDSVFVQVGGYPAINADIELEDDSICGGESVYLIASGKGGFRGPAEYRYKWEKPEWDKNPVQFAQPKVTTQYIVTVTDLCLSPAGADTVHIYVGDPEAPAIKAIPNESCIESDVMIYFKEWKENYEYNFWLGDGDAVFNAQNDTIFHKYNIPGCYDVTLEIETDFGCTATRFEPCLIKILESPKAAYQHDPLNPSTVSPIVEFRNQSENTKSFEWYLDDVEFETADQFEYEFLDTGNYSVSLVAVSPDGCIDTVTKTLHHSLAQTVYIPTSFSPNADKLNDVFEIVGEGIKADGFDFVVYDRWGNQVFRSKNPNFGWDGKHMSTGEYVNIGSYSYVLRYKDYYNEPSVVTGQILVSIPGKPNGLR